MPDTPLLDAIGVDAAERQRRLDFLRITAEDCRRLVEIAPLIEDIVDDVLDAFYEHLLAYPEAQELLAEPGRIERLKVAQAAHMHSLVSGSYDADYFESRLRVGIVHADFGVELRWYIGGLCVQLTEINRRLFEAYGGDMGRLFGYLDSFGKAMMLDIQLATESYIQSGFVERPLAEAFEIEAERSRQALLAKERAEARREELLSMVVHDIRSPVTAMMATARLGLRRYHDMAEPPGKQFGLIEESGGNVLRIIDEMLTLTRLPHDELPLRAEPFDVAELARGCVEELRPFASQSGHRISVEADSVIEATALDPVLVRRIVSNLLVNAFRHTPSGTQVILLARREGDLAILSVIDDGPGIPRATRETLLEERPLKSRRSQGAYVDSGLGLPFCRIACERMGGKIRLESTEGRGSWFVVELPLA